jgi:hypothetical protein
VEKQQLAEDQREVDAFFKLVKVICTQSLRPRVQGLEAGKGEKLRWGREGKNCPHGGFPLAAAVGQTKNDPLETMAFLFPDQEIVVVGSEDLRLFKRMTPGSPRAAVFNATALCVHGANPIAARPGKAIDSSRFGLGQRRLEEGHLRFIARPRMSQTGLGRKEEGRGFPADGLTLKPLCFGQCLSEWLVTMRRIGWCGGRTPSARTA